MQLVVMADLFQLQENLKCKNCGTRRIIFALNHRLGAGHTAQYNAFLPEFFLDEWIFARYNKMWHCCMLTKQYHWVPTGRDGSPMQRRKDQILHGKQAACLFVVSTCDKQQAIVREPAARDSVRVAL